MPSIRQIALFRQRVVKEALRKGNVSEAARMHKVSRQTVHRWLRRYDGTLESLMDRSRRPKHHPRAHKPEEIASLVRRETYDTSGVRTMSRTYHFDGLGSTAALSNENGSITDQYRYDAWGNVTHTYGSTSDNPYQYVGQLGYYTHYQEPDFELLQLGVRYYDPATGRFTSRDPEELETESAYSYAGGYPLTDVDPYGRIYDRAKCQRLYEDILRRTADLNKDKHRNPCDEGHFKEVMPKWRKLEELREEYRVHCLKRKKNPGPLPAPVPKPVLEPKPGKKPKPVPIAPAPVPAPVPVPEPSWRIPWREIGIGAAVVGGCAVIIVGVAVAPEFTIPCLCAGAAAAR